MQLTVAGPSRTRTGFRRLTTAGSLAGRAASLTDVSLRSSADQCPGLLRPFPADDGAIIRLRLPGGRVTVSALSRLLTVAERSGAPVLQLTSRGNLQVRALPTHLPPDVVDAVVATGLVPSPTHERVRNILAAPLARDLDPLVAAFDAALCADPVLARLPGRFLFAFSDASGSVLSERWDVAYQRLSSDSGLLYAGRSGRALAPADAVAGMLAVARRFVDSAPEGAWNVRDLLEDSPVLDGLGPVAPAAAAEPLRPGRNGAAVVAGVPLGMLTREHVHALAGVTDEVIVTPWRSIVVREGSDDLSTLRGAGLVTEPGGPWARLSACVGAPSCRRTTVTTLDLARSAAELVASRRLTVRHDVHVVGCERRCGTGASVHVLVAPPTVNPVVAALTDDAS